MILDMCQGSVTLPDGDWPPDGRGLSHIPLCQEDQGDQETQGSAREHCLNHEQEMLNMLQ